MKIGSWARLLLAATPFLAGCGNFWQAPGGGSSGSFTLTNSGAIIVSPGATSNDSSTITVTPGSSFTGAVALSCAITTAPSSATKPQCDVSPTSLTFSSTSTAAQTSTLTATTTSSSPATTTGIYEITVTGVSGSIAVTTKVCVNVTTTSTTSCTSTAGNSGNFYILNGGSSGAITGYFINSGVLTRIGSSISLAGVAPVAMAMAPNGKFLCVSTSSSGVFAYPITNGTLGSGVQVTSDIASSIQIDSNSSWLIEAVPYTGGNGGVTLNAIPISSTNGTYTLGTIPTVTIPVTNASLPNGQMVISGNNKTVFVALGMGGTVVVPFDSTNPFPTGMSSIPLIGTAHSGSALSVAVDPGTTPRLYYIGETLGNSAGNAGGLRAFQYSSLPSVSEIASSKIASGGLAPTFILPVATPDYVYVADGTGSITGFAITAASGPTYTISTGSTATAGPQPAGMAEDSTDSYVFVVGSSGSPYFDAYTFDPTTTGKLDSQLPSTTPATSIAIVAAPK